MKKFTIFIAKGLVFALMIFALMLCFVKHNEIHELLFSEESKIIATAVAVCFTCVITGFAICYFQFKNTILEEREKYLILKDKYAERTAQLKAVTKELHQYQQASREQQIQQEDDRRRNFFADIEDFPVDSLDDDLLDLLGNCDGDTETAHSPVEEG